MSPRSRVLPPLAASLLAAAAAATTTAAAQDLLAAERERATLPAADVRPWRLGAGIDHASAHAEPGAAGHDRLWFSASHANLWNRDHQATLRVAAAARTEHDTWSGAYRAPLPAQGATLGVVLTRADDGAGLDADGQAIRGAGHSITLLISTLTRHTLPPRADYQHHLQLSIADHDWFARDGIAAVRSRPLMLGYRGQREAVRIGWQFGVQALTNLPGGARNDAAAYALATAGATTSRRWTALRTEGEWLRILEGDIRLRIKGRAQWSDRALVRGEQFALGGTLAPWGSAFGVAPREPWLHRAGLRGLPERALGGDVGALASVELWSRRLEGLDLRAGGFVDAGQVRRRNAPPGIEARSSATSLGLALHWQLRGHLAASLAAAQLLDGGGAYRNGTRRVDLTLVAGY